ncbi:hypothetical protein BH23CHL4_BH23CHL4_00090 [soil metagenome]
MAQIDYNLTELTGAAGVSSRTVRYYIAEGLLPPPVAAGPRSSYSTSHLNRLMLIGRLKNDYLPLREIRKRLNSMSEAEIEEMLNQTTGPEPRLVVDRGPERHGHAASYTSQALGPSPIRHLRPASRDHSPTSNAFRRAPVSQNALDTHGDSHMAPQFTTSRPGSPETRAEGSTWRRLELGPDAELFIREDAYVRKQDRVEWLINWAKRVFN